MRRQQTIDRQYFEDLYTETPDPWNFASSDYERRKYQATLDALGDDLGDVLEIGCSIGVFTRRLARRCRRLLAVDISEVALDTARRSCADRPNLEFRHMQLPDEVPGGRFDVILLSEVGYYWTEPDLDRFVAWMVTALTPGGRCALVHWTGPTDYPLTGDQVHERVTATTGTALRPTKSVRDARYRLDILAKA